MFCSANSAAGLIHSRLMLAETPAVLEATAHLKTNLEAGTLIILAIGSYILDGFGYPK